MVLVLVASAWAQDNAVVTGGELPDLNAQTFRPAVDSTRLLWVDEASRVPEGPIGRVLFHYTSDPLVYQIPTEGGDDVASTAHLVGNVVQSDLIGGWAYGPGRFGLVVPLYLYADGDSGGETGLGDVALDGKMTLLDREEIPVAIAVQGRVALPTATVSLPLGNASPAWELDVVASTLVGPVLLAGNLGTAGGPDVALVNAQLDDAFQFRLGAGYDILPEDLGVALELSGRGSYAEPLTNVAGNPLEGLLSGWGRATDDLVVRAALGTGFNSGIGSADFRLMGGLSYAPAFRGDEVIDGPKPSGPLRQSDSDGDGLLDNVDTCPAAPEDLDGFEDADGCPDDDNDADGVLDADDACRDVAEDKDTWKDADGCPDPETQLTVLVVDEAGAPIDLARSTLLDAAGKSWPFAGSRFEVVLPPGVYRVEGDAASFDSAKLEVTVVDGPPMQSSLVLPKTKASLVLVTRERFTLAEQVFFDVGKATIKAASYPLLDEAVQVMKDYPEIVVLRIEGHTDSRGSDTSNLALSQKRAAAVVKYLVDHGIDAARLKAEGLGETRPLDPANNEGAWTKNRRVDFFVEKWVDIPTVVTVPPAP